VQHVRAFFVSILILVGALAVAFLFCVGCLFALAALAGPAPAHELWINGTRNPAGEWCCGAEDCGVVDGKGVHVSPRGYDLRGSVTYGEAVTGNAADGPTRREQVNETIPFNQALPSPDGAYWRCKRPDGSPRCFFAPPPGS